MDLLGMRVEVFEDRLTDAIGSTPCTSSMVSRPPKPSFAREIRSVGNLRYFDSVVANLSMTITAIKLPMMLRTVNIAFD